METLRRARLNPYCNAGIAGIAAGLPLHRRGQENLLDFRNAGNSDVGRIYCKTPVRPADLP